MTDGTELPPDIRRLMETDVEQLDLDIPPAGPAEAFVSVGGGEDPEEPPGPSQARQTPVVEELSSRPGEDGEASLQTVVERLDRILDTLDRLPEDMAQAFGVEG